MWVKVRSRNRVISPSSCAQSRRFGDLGVGGEVVDVAGGGAVDVDLHDHACTALSIRLRRPSREGKNDPDRSFGDLQPPHRRRL